MQVWAWSRMTSLSPDVHGYCHIVNASPSPDANDNNYDVILPIAPYGASLIGLFTISKRLMCEHSSHDIKGKYGDVYVLSFVLIL